MHQIIIILKWIIMVTSKIHNNELNNYFIINITVQRLVAAMPELRSVPIMRSDSIVPNIHPFNAMLSLLPIAPTPLIRITANSWKFQMPIEAINNGQSAYKTDHPQPISILPDLRRAASVV